LSGGGGGGARECPWRRREILGLLVALAACLAAAGYRAALVPIFQSPDEDTHYDYVVAIATSGRLLFASERPGAEIVVSSPFAPYAHPYTRHLALGTRAHDIRFRRDEKAPAGYGTRAFFSRLDETAPSLDRPLKRNPWLLARYPFGYYGLAALWVRAFAGGEPSAVGALFLARSYSVLLLGVGLWFAYLSLRRLRQPVAQALALTLALGLFPLSTFVGSYVQPDAQAFALVAICTWATLRVRDQAAGEIDLADLLAVGTALGLLLVTKYHVLAVTAPPLLALLALKLIDSFRQLRHWSLAGAALLGPAVTLFLVESALGQGRPAWLHSNLGFAATRGLLAHSLREMPAYVATSLRQGAADFFIGGTTFDTFWGRIGWNDTDVSMGSPLADRALAALLIVVTLALLALIGWRLLQCTRVVGHLWRRGRRRRSLWLLLANPLPAFYLLYTGLIFFLFVFNGQIGWQGRHWYPQLLAILWMATCFAPRALPGRGPRRLAPLLLVGLLVYEVLYGIRAVGAVESRYYDAASTSVTAQEPSVRWARSGRTAAPIAPRPASLG
jgi:hypothetical protein